MIGWRPGTICGYGDWTALCKTNKQTKTAIYLYHIYVYRLLYLEWSATIKKRHQSNLGLRKRTIIRGCAAGIMTASSPLKIYSLDWTHSLYNLNTVVLHEFAHVKGNNRETGAHKPWHFESTIDSCLVSQITKRKLTFVLHVTYYELK